jgi:hypothetical protein
MTFKLVVWESGGPGGGVLGDRPGPCVRVALRCAAVQRVRAVRSFSVLCTVWGWVGGGGRSLPAHQQKVGVKLAPALERGCGKGEMRGIQRQGGGWREREDIEAKDSGTERRMERNRKR